MEALLPLKIKSSCGNSLGTASPRVEVRKRRGPGNGICLMCGITEMGTHMMFTYVAAGFLWNFVHEALGPAWQASDLGEFLETQANRIGKRRRLFWLVFAVMTWTLWTIRNKMMIERVFLRRDSDSTFKFPTFLQH